MSEKKRIVVAMSGGVDSTTTAALLKSEGHEVIGVTMQLWDYGDSTEGCCTLDDVRDARRDAHRIGIPHYVVNYMDLFKKHIVEDFIEKYYSGQTPNPCVLCNQTVKFNFLLRRSLELDADYLATGHYARIVRDEGDGMLYLTKGVDSGKDQSYFLFGLTQKELARLLFPLGGIGKDEVRRLAEEFSLGAATKPESQDVCFLSGGDYREFLDTHGGNSGVEGDIVDTLGNALGRHSGIQDFTVGQRRGLGLGGGDVTYYVIRVEPETNTVVVGPAEELMRTDLTATDIVWTAHAPEERELRVKAKIRYRHKENDATVRLSGGGEAFVSFDTPQRAMTPGQAVVFYSEDRVLGGGWIREVH